MAAEVELGKLEKEIALYESSIKTLEAKTHEPCLFEREMEVF